MFNPELAIREADDARQEKNELIGDIFADFCPFGNCPFDPDGRDCPACIAEAVEMEDVADDEFCGCLECLGGEEETEWEWEDYEDDPGEYVEWQDLYGGDEDPPFPID